MIPLIPLLLYSALAAAAAGAVVAGALLWAGECASAEGEER